MTTFQYAPSIIDIFPAARAGVILAQGLSNGPSPKALQERFLDVQGQVLAEIGETPLSELETLSAWRGAFRKFGVNPTKYRSAIEALLRRLTKKGDIPSINALVDLGNLVSIRHRLPVAIFDTQALTGAVTVCLADGSERFTPLFEKEVEHPEEGEVIFADETGMVIARRWCWRQSDESAARPETTDAIIVTEAQHEGGEAAVEAALADLLLLLAEFSGGELISGVVGPGRPSISA